MRFLLTVCATALLQGRAWSLAMPIDGQDQQDEACQATSVDYTDGGSYLISGDTEGKFSYASRFTAVASTLWQTRLTTLPTPLFTGGCTAGRTQTVTTQGPPTTVVEAELIVEVIVDRTITSTTTTTSTLSASCRYPSSVSGASGVTRTTGFTTATIPRTTSTIPTAPRSTVTVIQNTGTSRATAPSQSTVRVTVTTPAPSAVQGAGGYTFTMSGSTCVINFASVFGVAGGGPPPWIISQWRGGPPPLLTQGAYSSGLWTCRGATATTRPRRDVTRAGVKRALTSTFTQTLAAETVTRTETERETVTRRGNRSRNMTEMMADLARAVIETSTQTM
ncbi:hypothetical protein B0T14DRAFT_590716 [Immersiella caudata]|uniref:Uncharacterized protein n=1 Tax=Immersiella caudata TaxID=314043 RepID=A0AA40BXV5_9PEZI|nr:hypothetical protein B0T14DRAFT_590716 [Immersiella caudata]